VTNVTSRITKAIVQRHFAQNTQRSFHAKVADHDMNITPTSAASGNPFQSKGAPTRIKSSRDTAAAIPRITVCARLFALIIDCRSSANRHTAKEACHGIATLVRYILTGNRAGVCISLTRFQRRSDLIRPIARE